MKQIRNKINQLFLCLGTIIIFASGFCFAQSIPATVDSRIKTLVYNPNEVYQLKFHYGYQSYIEFSDDEEIEMISIGESFAWRLTPAGKRIFIRPLEIAAHTNLTIITNKRTYQFDIRSGEYDGKADEELVYVIRFYYPQTGITLPIPPQLSIPKIPTHKTPSSKLIVKSPTPGARVDQVLDPSISGVNEGESLNLNYTFTGSDNIAPTKVYDNGKETFMQFKNNNLIIPSIGAVDIYGNERQVGYIIKDKFLVIPSVEIQFVLRLADSMVCVFNGQYSSVPKK